MTKEIQITNCYYFVICALAFVINAGCAQEDRMQARSAQSEELSATQQELAEAPDEMLSAFTVSGYTKGGKKQWDLEGKSADILDEEIRLKEVTSKVYGKDTDMTIVADEGSLNRLNNNVHLEKNVQATTEDGATLVTDYLDWDARQQRLTSDAHVRMQKGAMEAEGMGMISHPTSNLVHLKKDVTVKMFLEEKNEESTQKKDYRGLSEERPSPMLPEALEKEKALSPTVITCNGPLDVEYQNNLAVFQDNVKVEDKRGEIFADKMNIYFTTQAEEGESLEGMEGMGIEKMIATGEVEIHRNGNIAFGQKAVYDTKVGKLTLTGEPKLIIYSTEGLNQK